MSFRKISKALGIEWDGVEYSAPSHDELIAEENDEDKIECECGCGLKYNMGSYVIHTSGLYSGDNHISKTDDTWAAKQKAGVIRGEAHPKWKGGISLAENRTAYMREYMREWYKKHRDPVTGGHYNDRYKK